VPPRRRLALLGLLGLVAFAGVVGAANDRRSRDTKGTESVLPTVPPGVGGATSLPSGNGLRLSPVARLHQPVALAVRTDDPWLYLAEKSGRVRALLPGQSGGQPTAEPRLVLDLAGEVTTGSEQGLLGLAFSPEGRLLYVNYTDREGTTRVVEYAMADGRAVAASRRELLVVQQPFANHNGGNLVVGPDAMLWIGLGDGGSGNDPGNRAQSLDTLLGKMLRIDPRPSGGRPYGVPPGNPFEGRPGARPEIWSYGLRNPWRYSFDRATGDLWIGDVGQNAVEEIDLEPAGSLPGRNHGWPRFEGERLVSDRAAVAAVPPVFQYGHAGGNCSVTAGYVYRGRRLPALIGTYLYSDFCGGGIRALRKLADGRVDDRGLLVAGVGAVTSFGEDADGEVYVLSLEGPVYRIDPA